MKIRLHGRGGQGVKTAARIIGRAFFLSGYNVQDFAMYGAERRGAPVTSFVRASRGEILERGYIFSPDLVVLFDDTLNFDVVKKGLKGEFLVNTSQKIPGAKTVDATKIAMEIFGAPIVNTGMCGAVAKVLEIDLSLMERAIEIELKSLGIRDVGKNLEAARECWKRVS